jgi:hypothetical protein
MKGTFLADYRLEPTESGTRLRRLTGGFIAKPFTRGLLKLSGPFMSRAMDSSMEEFRKVIEEDWQQNAGTRVAPLITSESIAAAAAASLEQS